jgi:hypothetical protein
MKKGLVVLIVLFIGLMAASSQENSVPVKDTQLRKQDRSPVNVNVSGYVKPDLNFGKFPLYFIYNKGQVHKKAKFYAKASRYTLWLTGEGLIFDSLQRLENKDNAKRSRRDVSRLLFLNANKQPDIIPVGETKHRVNYFKGNKKSQWKCDIPTSQAVLYKGLYKQIDLRVYGIEKQVEYDWIVKPGGNPGDIQFVYKNVKNARVDKNGNLVIETKFGELLHKRPVSYQFVGDKKTEVIVEFKKTGRHTYGFEIGEFNKKYSLIIDPVVLAYSTYIGGINQDYSLAIAVDDNGSAYISGFTYAPNFPTLNEFQTDQIYDDAFVTKIDTTKSGDYSLVYSTYLGGSRLDHGRGIAVDSSGNVYVTGDTSSTDFPILNQYQSDQGAEDAFVVKLDTTKSGISSLVYSTYLGSSGSDMGRAITVDENGVVYVTGVTWESDFPILNQYQVYQARSDVFVTKLDTTKSGESGLIYSTYLGGGDDEYGRGIAVDNNSCVYVVGDTYSSDFPIQAYYQSVQSVHDIFVTKLDTTKSGSSSLVYSTYLGGNGDDRGMGIAVDNDGNAFVAGETSSTNFPILNQYQSDQGGYDAFAAQLNTKQSGTSSLIYSTYLGGNGLDYCTGIAIDKMGYVYVTGGTNSSNFPILNEYQSMSLNYDTFVTKLDMRKIGFAGLIYSTYLGGSAIETSRGIAVDNKGNAYITGQTSSADYPIKNQYQTDPEIQRDAFVTKLVFPIPAAVMTKPVSAITATTASCGGNVTYDGGDTVTAKGVCWSTSPNPRTFDSFTTDGAGTGTFTSSLTGLTANTTYYVRAYATNSIGTAYGNEVSFTTVDYSSTPGAITITNPRDCDSVSGTVIIIAEVNSNRSNSANTSAQTVTHVQFYIDNVLEKQDTRAPYKHRWDTTLIPNGSHTIRARAFYANGQTGLDEIAVNVINSNAPPYIQLNRSRLNFGAITGESQTGAQTFLIENSGGCCLDWTASESDSWIKATPLSGTANMLVTVTIDASGLSAGKYQGSVTINSVNADNSPVVVDIYLDVKEKAQEEPPFGSFDSPLDGADVYSTVPLTGWALDDIEVASVKIFRNPVEGHETGLIYIGDAVLVEGARPDVETGYPGFPKSYQAGWGYQMLTNFLPNGGNGTYMIHAIATDSSGNEVTLGSKTIACDNEHAVKPFGTIDIPTQGGVASGQDFVNFGWVLTPRPNMIPKDGSTIDVWIDGVLLAGHPVYNQYRKDIADGFPNYANSNGAVGYYYLDTTLYANGVHTISWSVTDNAGNTDGLGSRYFNILNIQNKAAARTHYKPVPMDFDVQKPDLSPAPVYLKKGYSNKSIPGAISPDKEGIINIVIKENERMELRISSPSSAVFGYMKVGDTIRPLPTGSTWNASTGVFYWQSGPGYLGEYRFVFIEKSPNGKICKKRIRVLIIPKH